MQHLKIADFGLSSILQSDRSMLVHSGFAPRGTANYLAPEVLTGKELTTAADVYAFGILLWQCLTRKHPYEDIGAISMDGFTGESCGMLLLLLCLNGCADYIVDEESRPEIEESQRHDYPMLVELIEHCWEGKSASRPQFEDVCEVISDALVEIAIPHDLDAQRFWLKFFSTVGLGVKIDRVIRAVLKVSHGWFIGCVF
jgi:serine/threonine protein kinase